MYPGHLSCRLSYLLALASCSPVLVFTKVLWSLYFLNLVARSSSGSDSAVIVCGGARPLHTQQWSFTNEGLWGLGMSLSPMGREAVLLFLTCLAKLLMMLQKCCSQKPRVSWCLCRGNSSRAWAVFPALASRRSQDRAVMGVGGRSLRHGSATLCVPPDKLLNSLEP